MLLSDTNGIFSTMMHWIKDMINSCDLFLHILMTWKMHGITAFENMAGTASADTWPFLKSDEDIYVATAKTTVALPSKDIGK